MPTAPRDERPQTRPQHRIAKLLARAGIASRREVERMIADGRVAKDGVAIDTPATLLSSLHGVTVDGTPVAAPAPARLFLFHKPPGVLTTERDPRGRRTIYDVLPRDLPRLVPVGRLDLNTEGLLLLTTDGGFKRQLELPATGVERAYRARAYGKVSQPQLEDLIDGIEIDGIRYGPIDANIERRTGANVWIELVLREGKNREVRRVLEHLGLEVSRLIRTRYGPFVLGDLPPGGVGEVRAADLVAFRQTLTKGAASEARVAVAAPAAGRRRARVEPSERPVARTSRAGIAPIRRPAAVRAKPPGKPAETQERPVARGPRTDAARPKRDDTGQAGAPRKPASAVRHEPAADNAAGQAHAGRPARPPKRKAGWAKPKPRTTPGKRK